MRILVTGAEGQLGCSIRRAAIGLADDYIFTDVMNVALNGGNHDFFGLIRR